MFEKRVPLSSTAPSVQHISSTQKGHSFSAPKSLSSTPKTPQFDTKTPFSSKAKTPQFNLVFVWACVELRGF